MENQSRYADELKIGRCEGWAGANSVEEGGHAHRDGQMGKHETEEGKHKGDNRKRSARATTDNS